MDETEKIAKKFLKSKGYLNVKYEPDGNVPPDFLLDGEIAVEVRRLNQSIIEDNKIEGLEKVEHSLRDIISGVLSSFGPPMNGNHWLVNYIFERPKAPTKQIKRELKKLLESFKEDDLEETLICGLKIIITKTTSVLPNRFNLCGVLDEDSGGSLLKLYERNIRICLDDKTDKIAEVREKYAKWWLLLVDMIGYGLKDFEVEIILERLRIEHDWDKLIVLDPNGSNRSFEL